MRPLKNNLIVRQIEPERKSGVIELLSHQSEFSSVEVIAKGPDCYGEFEVGDTLWVYGYRSGVKLEDSVYLVNEDICVAKEEK